MFDEFIRICVELNRAGITPLLFGSLGLERVTGRSLEPNDIDMLVPEVYLNEKWDVLCQVAENSGYSLIDLHEHEFVNGCYRMAFAGIEGLVPFAGIGTDQIRSVIGNGCIYLLLDLEQYLQVYLRSAQDGYRRSKNHGKDDSKIALLRQLLA